MLIQRTSYFTSIFPFLFLIFSIIYSDASNETVKKSTNTNVQDSLALVALFNSTNGNNWIRKDNWLKGPVKSWYGIEIVDSRVTVVDLDSNFLTGYLPKEIGMLTEISELNLSKNEINGELPVEIGQLQNLDQLILGKNNFQGRFPEQVLLLPKLNFLNLSRNEFSGELPYKIGEALNLRALWLENNSFVGSIPISLFNLPRLTNLNLSNNQLTDFLPNSDLPSNKLQELRIDKNRLTFEDLEGKNDNTIPDFFYSPQAAIDINLGFNKQNDPVLSVSCGGTLNRYHWYLNNLPLDLPDIDTFITLENFSGLNYGNYQCKVTNYLVPDLTIVTFEILLGGPLQDSLALVEIYNSTQGPDWIRNDSWLEGPLNTWFGVTLTNGRVTNLNLPNNNLMGVIPVEIGELSALKDLDISNNKLVKVLPKELDQLTGITNLNLSGNLFDSIACTEIFRNGGPSLHIENNYFTFEDFEPLSGRMNNCIYWPQNKIGNKENVMLKQGDNYEAVLTCGGSENQYIWHTPKGDMATDEFKLRLTDVDRSDSGEYYCSVSNSLVSNLIIESEKVLIEIEDEGPSDLILSVINYKIEEDMPPFTLIGIFSAIDNDKNESFEYSLVDGEGDTDNNNFTISGDSLYTRTLIYSYFNSTFTIRVQVKDRGGNVHVEIFRIKFEGTLPPLQIPEIITPNADGFNDKFIVKNSEGYEISITIFDRNGIIHYQCSDYSDEKAWNGLSEKNKILPSGTYFYVLEYSSESYSVEKQIVKGSVYLKY